MKTWGLVSFLKPAELIARGTDDPDEVLLAKGGPLKGTWVAKEGMEPGDSVRVCVGGFPVLYLVGDRELRYAGKEVPLHSS